MTKRVFLQLKSCEDTRFLYSKFTGGVADGYALSDRWELNRFDAVIANRKPMFPYTVALLCYPVEWASERKFAKDKFLGTTPLDAICDGKMHDGFPLIHRA